MAKKSAEEKKQSLSVFICWIAITCMYMGRNSYSANITLIEDSFSVSHAQAGFVMTLFFIAYGIMQVVHGLLCSRYNKKIMVPLCLLVPAAADLIVALGVPFPLIKYLWFINAVFQSAVWPLAIQTVSENVSAKNMRRALFVISTTTSLGTLAVYGLSAVLARTGKYNYIFYTGAAIMFIVAVIWFLCYEKGDYLERGNIDSADGKKTKMARYLLPPLILFSAFSIVINFVKDGLLTFSPAIIKNLYNMPDSTSIWFAIGMPLLGAFGGAFSIFMNKYIKKFIPLEIFFFTVILIFNAVVIAFSGSIAVMVVSFAVLGMLLHGSTSVITSILPLSLRDNVSSGALTGILNGGAYLGSALSTYILGAVADKAGWSAVFVPTAVSLLICVCAGVLFWAFAARDKRMRI